MEVDSSALSSDEMTLRGIEDMTKPAAGALFAKFCLQMHKCSKAAEKQAQHIAMRAEADEFLQTILQFSQTIASPYPHVDLCKWLVSGGREPEEFRKHLYELNSSAQCGFIWVPGFIAYRCRTCSQNQAMSLCSDCFMNGNHEGHDFNMFRSQTGGACDCGDLSVMKRQGFCTRHGKEESEDANRIPEELLLPARCIVPTILRRLLVLFRELTFRIEDFNAWDDGSFAGFNTILEWLSDCGSAMKRVITQCLMDKAEYENFLTFVKNLDRNTPDIMVKFYNEAVSSLTPIYAYHELEVYDCLDLYTPLSHQTLMDEVIFWMIKYEFPQRIINFLLTLLTEGDFKDQFASSYAEHYGHLARVLGKQQVTDALSNRVIHVNVQFFSSEPIVLNLVNNHCLLRRVVFSLHSMIRYCLVGTGLKSSDSRVCQVVDCRSLIISNHNYWAIILDLHNLLTIPSVTAMFLRDPVVLEIWMRMTMSFQGMNMNIRELRKHIEFESRTYSVAFTAELELFVMTMWSMMQNLTKESSFDCILLVHQNVVSQLKEWFNCIQYSQSAWWRLHSLELSFHYPLHRTCAAFFRRGFGLGMKLRIPAESFLRVLLLHPLQMLVGRCEIATHMWVFNGTSMRYQAYLYAQSLYCYSFVDLDIYLLQFCMRKCNPDWFVLTVFDRFHIAPWFSLPKQIAGPITHLRSEWVMPMIEGALRLLATLFSLTANLGCSEMDISYAEVAALLSYSDRTYSLVTDHLPEKTGILCAHSKPDVALEEVADYQEPKLNTDGKMSSGIYVPNATLWERFYDPLFVLHRTYPSPDYQRSFDRFKAYVKTAYNLSSAELANLWPPLRIPDKVMPVYESMRRALHCSSLHGIIFVMLYKAVHEEEALSEMALCLCVHLIELAVRLPYTPVKMPNSSNQSTKAKEDGNKMTGLNLQMAGWFTGHSILTNISQRMHRVLHSSEFASAVSSKRSTETTFLDLLWLTEQSPMTSLERSAHDEGQSGPAKEIPYIDAAYQTLPESAGQQLRRSRQAEAVDPFFNLTIEELMKMFPENINEILFLNEAASSKMDTTENANDNKSPLLLPCFEGLSSSAAYNSTVINSPRATMFSPYSSDDYSSFDEMYTANDSADQPYTEEGKYSSRDLCCPTTVENSLSDDQPGSSLSLHSSSAASSMEVLNQSVDAPDAASEGVDNEGSFAPRVAQKPEKPPPMLAFKDLGGHSILSLLIHLHDTMTKKSGRSTFYKPPEKRVDETLPDLRIGDGPFFIRKILDRVYFLSDSCRCEVDRVVLEKSAKSAAEEALQSSSDFSEKKRKALACRQRLMTQFRAHQADVMEKFKKDEPATTEEAEHRGEVEKVDSEEVIAYEHQIGGGEVFECSVCNVRAAGSPKNPMCLLIHAQPTNVLSQQTTRDEVEELFPTTPVTRLSLENALSEQLAPHFAPEVYLAARGFTSAGGLYVQSCGHFVHKDCHMSYLRCLKNDQIQLNSSSWNLKQGEMSCPCCRRICNGVLPVVPVFSYFQHFDAGAKFNHPSQVSALLNADNYCVTQIYSDVFAQFIGTTWGATCPQFSRDINESRVIQSFVANTAGITCEINAMIENTKNTRSMRCNELFLRTVSLVFCEMEHIRADVFTRDWNKLTGAMDSCKPSSGHERNEKRVPILLYSPPWLLLRFVMLLRHVYFTEDVFFVICRAVWNLLVAQFCIAELFSLKPEYRQQLSSTITTQADCSSLSSLMSLILSTLSQYASTSYLLEQCDRPSCATNLADLEERLDERCLSFLRFAAFVKSLAVPSANLTVPDQFSNLEILKSFCLNVNCKRAYWFNEVHVDHLHKMVAEFVEFDFLVCRRKLAKLCGPRVFVTPRLIQLPMVYDALFQKYHNAECSNCKRCPTEALLCLVCGQFLCFRDHCCRRNNITEAEQHAIQCSAGTGVFLSIHTCFIIITRHKRCVEWGCVYLDSHGEEDRGLMRGKPLKLCVERYALLERQWLWHTFDFVQKRWTWITRNPNVYSVIA